MTRHANPRTTGGGGNKKGQRHAKSDMPPSLQCRLAADFRQPVTSSADAILPSALPEPLRGNVPAEMRAVEMDQLHGRIGSGLSGSQIRA